MTTTKTPPAISKLMLVTIALVFVAIFAIAPVARALGSGPADFESGLPAVWFVYNGGSTSVTPNIVSVGTGDPLVRPGQTSTNAVLTTTYNLGDYGGFGQDLAGGGAQDWSHQDGVSLWFNGSNSGLTYQLDIMDNRSDPNTDTAERFFYQWVDNTSGWRRIAIPWASFARRTDFQPGGAPNDGLGLTEMWGWAFVLPNTSGSPQTFSIDDVALIDHVIDDFEQPLPSGTDPNSIPVGFLTFNGAGSTISIAQAATPPAPISFPFGSPNSVIQVDVDVTSYAGFIHNFTNAAADTWVPQNWTSYEGFAFWIYGQNTGTTLFIDILENRNPGSTTDDAERWTASFTDDFSGWKYIQMPFNSLVRKDVGNGAPNDGLLLNEVYGWAFGTLGTGGPVTYYIDQASLYGDASALPLKVSFKNGSFNVTEGGLATVTARLSRTITSSDPATVTVDYALSNGSAIAGQDYTTTSGTLTFTYGGPVEQSFTVQTADNNKYTGGRTVIARLSDPSGAQLGSIQQSIIFIDDDEDYDPLMLDDFETPPYLWVGSKYIKLLPKTIASASPLALPGQGASEGMLGIRMPINVQVRVSNCSSSPLSVVQIIILTTPTFDAATVNQATVRYGNAQEFQIDPNTGQPKRRLIDDGGDGDLDLVIRVYGDQIGYSCAAKIPLTGATFAGDSVVNNVASSFYHNFAAPRDWSEAEALRFWYRGKNSGNQINVILKDNGTEAPPSGWQLQWADEFNDSAGTAPNAANWTHEIGDGSANGNPGWGNSELEYYTNSTNNAATDGSGNLQITLREATGSEQCYYGPCQYTSARLISANKQEFAYGRIESRIKVPQGEGLWPAFWMLGTNIGQVGWPQSGEIDIMEFVGRLPHEIFGTIHGPGYFGGNGWGNTHTFVPEVSDSFHTFAIEWEPNAIRWYVDGTLYHTASPSDVSPNEWVFNHDFFVILNMAVGGNFGGPVGVDTTFPAAMSVDYVRVYGTPDNAERYFATFTDNFYGWQQITLPFSSFARSSAQLPGAPNDGLNLTAVNGFGFAYPNGSTGINPLLIDQIQLVLPPPPTAITVTTAADSGPGSLRAAISKIAPDGTITFAPALAGQTITLNGVLTLAKNMTIDATDAPGLTVSGNNADRVFIVNAGVTATISHMIITNGYGWEVGGAVLNNGTLTLNYSTVQNSTVAAAAGDFWKGGGGIYNGDSSTLNLNYSTVVGNTTTVVDAAGIYGFFNSTLNINNSTIKDNIAAGVGAGLRTLGTVNITNSTITGNQTSAWYGAAIFHTDGVMTILNSTIAGNTGPAGNQVIFVGTFTAANATLTLTNTIVANNTGGNCFAGFFGGGTVTLASGGNNIASDGSCNLSGSGDQPSTDPLLGALGLYGGSTLTYSLQATSPAIDVANPAFCPAADQRDVLRPQGPVCDIGAFEYGP